MKNLILGIICFVLLLVFTADLLAQRSFESVQIDTNTTTTAAFRVTDGQYFTGVKLPDFATDNDTIFFLVSYDGAAANFDTLYYDGAMVYVQIDTISHYQTFDFKMVFPWEWWKIVMENAVNADKTLIPYKNVMK